MDQPAPDPLAFQPPPISKSHRKSAYLLSVTIDNLFRRHPVASVILVTLTFAGPVHSTQFAHDRLNSMLNKARKRYAGYIWVLQPQKSGRIHYHILFPVPFDAHRDTFLDAWANRRNYTNSQRSIFMNPQLREESAWWDKNAGLFGFGITEVAPIYSTAELIGKYLMRLDWMNLPWPFQERKGVQFWRCSTNLRSGSVRFSWANLGGRRHRALVQEFARTMGCNSLDDLRRKEGRYWGYYFRKWRTLVEAMEETEEGHR